MSTALAPVIDDATLFSSYLALLEADPLKQYRHASVAAERFVEVCKQVEHLWTLEVGYRGGNGSGKTRVGASLGVSLARGLTHLGGTPLPKLPVPNVGWVLVQTRMQQIDASQAAYLTCIGNWPHKISYVSGEGKGYIERIDVATAKCEHGMDKRCQYCSRIMFHCAESDSSIGGRIHWAHADELPPEKLWGEVRARFSAGTPLLKFLTYTPLFRYEWAWIADQFKNCFETIVDRRIEFRSTIKDNRFISKEQAASIMSDWKDDPFYEARINGDFVDTEGDCPFDVPRLQEWKKRLYVVPPEIREVSIIAEKTTDAGRIREPRIVRYEVWEDVDPEDSYLLIADPSTGVRSKAHDPAGFHVWSRLKRKIVARFNDYLEPYGLGWLIGKVAPIYNNALVDVDMTGGYGAPTITALSTDLKHRNINRDYQEHRPGTIGSQLGFKITSENRSEITTAIQRALAEESCIIPSEAVISCLLGCTVDEKGKYLAAPGRHDEDMICMGRALHLMDTMGKPAKRILTPRERIEKLGFIPSRLLEEEEQDEEIMEDAWL